jgi:hypothetical protein
MLEQSPPYFVYHGKSQFRILNMSNHNFKAQRRIQASKQRVATERWLAKPG